MNSAKVGVLASIIQYKVWQSSRGGGAEHGLLVAADVCDMCDTHSTCSSSSSSSRLWNYSLCKSTATCWILNKSLHESAARSQSILNFLFLAASREARSKTNRTIDSLGWEKTSSELSVENHKEPTVQFRRRLAGEPFPVPVWFFLPQRLFFFLLQE